MKLSASRLRITNSVLSHFAVCSLCIRKFLSYKLQCPVCNSVSMDVTGMRSHTCIIMKNHYLCRNDAFGKLISLYSDDQLLIQEPSRAKMPQI